METVKILAAIFALAFLAESLTEYLFGTLADKVTALTPYRWTLMYISAAVGVGLAFHYQFDVISLILSSTITWVGILLTGLVIGRGANFVHQFVSEYLPSVSGGNG
jgi:hypothetical protein